MTEWLLWMGAGLVLCLVGWWVTNPVVELAEAEGSAVPAPDDHAVAEWRVDLDKY